MIEVYEGGYTIICKSTSNWKVVFCNILLHCGVQTVAK